ncbi:hypothetical protein OROMI_006587 [Orobanche minor]
MSRVKELEAERWRAEENLALKLAELSELKNNYNVLKQENADVKAHVLEQEEKNAKLVSELMDVLDKQAAHAVTQGGNQVKIQENGDGKTPNSMYKKLKDRKRKQVQDDDFDYGPQRKAASRNTKGAPARSKKNEAFLKSLDRRQRNNCARLLSNECIDKILSVKTKDLGETVYCSESGKTIVVVKDIFNIFLGNFVDNFVVDAYGMELLGHTSTTSRIVNNNCWSFVKKNMDDASLVYNDFVEAQKKKEQDTYFSPINSTGPSPGGEPYHWTLLVWDFVAEEWSHYNSLKPRQPAGFDAWFEDAIFLIFITP